VSPQGSTRKVEEEKAKARAAKKPCIGLCYIRKLEAKAAAKDSSVTK
jgi:hypothetical protein